MTEQQMCNRLIDFKLMILFFPNNHKALKLGRTTDEYETVYIRGFYKAYSKEEWALHSKGFINPQISLLFLIVKPNMETNFGLLFYMSPSYFTQFNALTLNFHMNYTKWMSYMQQSEELYKRSQTCNIQA